MTHEERIFYLERKGNWLEEEVKRLRCWVGRLQDVKASKDDIDCEATKNELIDHEAKLGRISNWQTSIEKDGLETYNKLREIEDSVESLREDTREAITQAGSAEYKYSGLRDQINDIRTKITRILPTEEKGLEVKDTWLDNGYLLIRFTDGTMEKILGKHYQAMRRSGWNLP